MVDVITTGENQNSYITFEEANALLLGMVASFFELGDQLDEGDEAYLLEAASDLDCLWRWSGRPTDNQQALAWPRKDVAKPGFKIPAEPGWNTPYDPAAWLQYKIMYLDGTQNVPMIDSATVPKAIKEAQALIAMLRKKEGNLIGDTNDDTLGDVIGPLRTGYVNAVRKASEVHKRTSQFGNFIGDGLLRVPSNG